MSKMSRKIRQYINHCLLCEFNQTKRHATYEKLMSIVTSIISFKVIAMNFIVTFSKQFDSVLTMINKTFKRVNIILEKFTWNVSQWTNAFLNRLFIANWNFSENIISNRNSKFLSKFWTNMFKRLKTTLLIFTVYHSQIDKQFEKTNQTFEIILKFFITKHSETNWITTLFLIQTNMNNVFNATINLTSNQIIYDFKIRNKLTAVLKNFEQFTFILNKKFKKVFDDTQF